MRFAADVFRGKRVFVTGHTGFKGSWLSEWLLLLGAEVWGFSLPPPTQPSLFEQLGLGGRMARHQVGDIRNDAELRQAVAACRPHFVFHLAAQPLVRASYEIPVATFATNVMGTVNLLEALRGMGDPCVAVAITTDKCYENRERDHAYAEDDPLGGHDPYSASKGAAEIAISSYRRSFFSPAAILAGKSAPVALASARAGNVIGGGDWARDRIVPDSVRSLMAGEVIGIRHPGATRPWQHVLEPLGGYLTLAAQMESALAVRDAQRLELLCSPFNFGPLPDSNRPVRELVDAIVRHWPGRWEDRSDPSAVHEATLLSLAIAKADRLLQWRPRWSFATTVERSIAWYREMATPRPARAVAEFTRAQIADYGT